MTGAKNYCAEIDIVDVLTACLERGWETTEVEDLQKTLRHLEEQAGILVLYTKQRDTDFAVKADPMKMAAFIKETGYAKITEYPSVKEAMQAADENIDLVAFIG